MTDEERAKIDAMFAAQDETLERRFRIVAQEFSRTLADANQLAAAGEAREVAAEKRAQSRELAYDERNDRVEQRAERQTVAWERMAAALERLAK